MKAIAFALLFLLVTGMTGASAQTDDSTRYVNGLPLTDDDSASQAVRTDHPPYDKLIPVKPERLPAPIRRALDDGGQYEGWRDTIVYRNANTGIYLVPVKAEDGIRIFGLNARGKPVSFREVSKPADQRE